MTLAILKQVVAKLKWPLGALLRFYEQKSKAMKEEKKTLSFKEMVSLVKDILVVTTYLPVIIPSIFKVLVDIQPLLHLAVKMIYILIS